MSKSILVCGFGPGISSAVASRFGHEGFRVGLVARTEERLQKAATDLAAKGIEALPLVADLSDPGAVKRVVERACSSFGRLDVIHWNAYALGVGDPFAAEAKDVRQPFEVGVVGLLSAVQAAASELKTRAGALLVTGSALALHDSAVDAFAAKWKLMSLAISKAAQHKLVGLLAETLRSDGVYVGEVIVKGTIVGSAFDTGGGNLAASTVAEKFWELYRDRNATSALVSASR